MVNLCPGLLALDAYATTDEELMEGAHFGAKFSSCGPHLQLPPWVPNRLNRLHNDSAKKVSDEVQIAYVQTVLMSVSWINRLGSPSILIQKNFRAWREKRNKESIYHLAAGTIQKRISHLIYQERLRKQLADLLVERGEGGLLVSARDGRMEVSSCIIQAKWREVIFLRKQKKVSSGGTPPRYCVLSFSPLSVCPFSPSLSVENNATLKRFTSNPSSFLFSLSSCLSSRVSFFSLLFFLFSLLSFLLSSPLFSSPPSLFSLLSSPPSLFSCPLSRRSL